MKKLNNKLARKTGMYIAIATFIGMCILWFCIKKGTTNMVEKDIINQMSDAVNTRADIIENYVLEAEEYLEAFALSSDVKNLLKEPNKKENIKKAQDYTVKFAKVKGIFEGLYIANNDTYVYTHTSKVGIGITCRKGESLKSFKKDILSKKGITNLGIIKSPSTGNLVISMYYPIYDKGKSIGFVGAAVYANNLMDDILKLKANGGSKSEYVFLDASSGVYLYNKDEKLLNTKIDEKGYLNIIEKVKKTQNEKASYSTFNDNSGVKSIVAYKYIKDRNWIFMIKDSQENVFKEVSNLKTLVGFLCFIILFSIMFITLVVFSKVGKTLNKVEKSIIKLGNIDLNAAIDVEELTSREDEIGSIAKAVTALCNIIKNTSEDIGRILSEIANENLTVDVDENKDVYIGEFKTIKYNLDTIKKKLVDVMLNISSATEQVNSGAEQIAMVAQNLSSGVQEQNVSIDKCASQIESIGKEVDVNYDKCVSARDLMNKTSECVDEVNDKVEHLTKAMSDINDSSSKISSIIKAIEDIAFQTNILALNAAVEAKRAGEAGKGFAVVAEEVRSLASKSAAAANNTTELIERCVESVKNGSNITEKTAEVMKSLNEYTVEVKEIVDNISESSHNQAYTIKEINSDINRIVDVVQANAAISEESATAAEELSGQSEMLKELVEKFEI